MGPALTAISGVSTHLRQLLSSSMTYDFQMSYFQIGSEGRGGGQLQWLKTLSRVLLEPAKFAKTLIRNRPDIVHLNTSLVPRSVWRDMAYLVIGKVIGPKMIVQIHGGSLDHLSSHHRFSYLLYRLAIRFADALMVLSSREADAHRSMKVSALAVVPNAIDLRDYASSQPKHYVHESVRLVFVGRLHRDKGVFELLEAARVLRDAGYSFTVDFAGSGPAEREMRQLVSAFELEDRVRILGMISGVRKQEFWRRAELLVLPSHHEGLPYAVLESMASATPVVTTPVGALPDTIVSGVHGCLVPPRNAMVLARTLAELFANRQRLRDMSQACVERANTEYGLERLTRQLTDVYKVVLSDHTARPLRFVNDEHREIAAVRPAKKAARH